MLFNSPEFLIWFLPITLATFFLLARVRRDLAVAWLVLACLFFYGWWRLEYVPILVTSVLVNFALGVRLGRAPSRMLLAFGIAANLCLLILFKYSFFLIENVGWLAGEQIPWVQLALPLGISFFTFQQIAYLVDANQGIARETRLLDYSLFVTFFPQLIAGPIVHHKEMMPQFARSETFHPRLAQVAIGITVFSIGLFKKVVIADNLAPVADLAFDRAADGYDLRLTSAWIGSVTYTLQLYFDFSGYSDMALGLGRMFGINLPLNFNSPFKARNIIEFWRRWHISLTRFFTAYVFNPLVLGITRRRMANGKPLYSRRLPTPRTFVALLALPTLFTMFLTGVWHGAGWQFVVFGLLHGAYLVINHAWLVLRGAGDPTGRFYGIGSALAVALTFISVTISLVFFRAESVPHALSIVSGMFGLHGVALPGAAEGILKRLLGGSSEFVEFGTSVLKVRHMLWAAVLLAVCWALPNTQEWMRRAEVGVGPGGPDPRSTNPSWWLPSQLSIWRPNLLHGAFVGVLIFLVAIQLVAEAPSRFLYFNF